MKTLNVNVYMRGKRLRVIPIIFSGIHVKADFFVNQNQLTSLKNSPEIVDGYFACHSNKLSNLVGAPRIVGGDFSFGNNRVQSLEGCPKEVMGNFICYGNIRIFTAEEIRAVCKVRGMIVNR